MNSIDHLERAQKEGTQPHTFTHVDIKGRLFIISPLKTFSLRPSKRTFEKFLVTYGTSTYFILDHLTCRINFTTI